MRKYKSVKCWCVCGHQNSEGVVSCQGKIEVNKLKTDYNVPHKAVLPGVIGIIGIQKHWRYSTISKRIYRLVAAMALYMNM